MSGPAQAPETPITSKAQLVEYLAQGSKPESDWRIGTEHEKFAYNTADFRALPYEGAASIKGLLTGLQRFGWEPVMEGDNVIALTLNGQSITLDASAGVDPLAPYELVRKMRHS